MTTGRLNMKMTSTKLGISIGVLVSLICGFVYISVLHEPGPAFYWFAAAVFLGGPLIAAITAASHAQERKIKTGIVSSASVFGIILALFVIMYAVLPQYSRTSIELPESCIGFDGSFNPPAGLAYTLPDARAGILLTEDAESAVVATIDGSQPPFSSTLYLIHKRDHAILRSVHFNSDVVTASIYAGTVYVYNDKLGYLIDQRTGKFEENILLMDNYGGLSDTDRPFFITNTPSGRWYLETKAVISSWNTDGTVKSRPNLTFSGIARGCFVSGSTGEIVKI